MHNVSIMGLNEVNGQVKLSNGSIVVATGLASPPIVFLVTSFRNQTCTKHWEPTNSYCSLVRLSDGYIDFEEPCSRFTNDQRILSHINNHRSNRRYTGIRIIPKDGYSLNINVDREAW